MNNQTLYKWLHMIAFIFVIVGGIDWGVFGLFTDSQGYGYDFIELAFRPLGGSTLVELIDGLIGLAAVYLAITHVVTKECTVCSGKR